jgi:hypothetical protein
MQMRCADCGCLREECKSSKSSSECPHCNRKLEEEDGCCCWAINTVSKSMKCELYYRTVKEGGVFSFIDF